jgi:hypothetical protein
MCCTPGRCPCWPQQEPFNDAEMDVLRTLQDMVMLSPSRALWTRLQKGCLILRRRRVPYVLSTHVRHYVTRWSVTPLFYADCIVRNELEWLLGQGVCPNMTIVDDKHYTGWVAGRVHPGRPALRRHHLHQLKPAVDVLLRAHGSYPMHSMLFPPEPAVSLLQRQWRRWHGRAARRVWLRLHWANT